LNGIPPNARAAQGGSFNKTLLSETNLANVRALNEIARRRGQTLAQMAIAWVLRRPTVTSALIGASRWSQIEDCLGGIANTTFDDAELAQIDSHALDGGLNLWARSSQE
jgi:L-glyceraldehyde 3-phosphate reductase